MQGSVYRRELDETLEYENAYLYSVEAYDVVSRSSAENAKTVPEKFRTKTKNSTGS